MDMTVTTTIRLYPTSEQEYLLSQTAACYVDACNYISQWIIKNKTTSTKKIHNGMYYTVRSLTGLKAQMAASSIRTVVATYKTIHDSQPRFSITAQFKKHRYVAVYNRDYNITKKENVLSLNTINGRIKVAFSDNHFLPLSSGKMGTATIHHRRGKWLMHIPLTITVADTQYPTMIVGIDRGIRQIIATYDSNHTTRFVSGREVRDKRGKFKDKRSELQRRNTRSSRKRLKKIGNRENRWMTNVNHCIAKALVESYSQSTLFVLEDLTGIRAVTTAVRKKDRYVQVSWAYYQLGQFITYKAERKGHSVIFVDPRYTSQTCPKCGHREKANRKRHDHFFCCEKCHYMSNDDRIAAMNLYDKGIKYLRHIQLHQLFSLRQKQLDDRQQSQLRNA